jgi:acetyl esterase/lipase
MLHGGSWTEGDKADLDDVVNLVRNQYPEAAIINMNYTLAANTPATVHPSQMNDINALINYVDSKRALWQVGEKTGLAGVSAGAHLSLLYSYAFNTGNMVKCVVSIVGPADFSDPFYTGNVLFQAVASNLLGKTWAQDPDLHRSVSPALRVSSSSPPTFMAYGRLDPLVPISNPATLKTRLQTNGITHTYVEYPNEGHEFSQTAIDDVVPKVVTFLRTHL